MIEKITDHNLERYDSRLKEWCDRKFFEKGNYGKYETTEEAGAVAFYPAPDTPLEGKVKFSFKETMPTGGNKGLDNPSVITGISNIEIIRWGKNINNDAGSASWPDGYSRYATRDLDGWIIGEVPANVDSNPAWQTRFNKQLPAQRDYCLVIEIAAIDNLFGLKFSYHNTDNVPYLYNDNYRTPEVPGVYVIPLFHYTTHQNAAEPINLLRPDTWSAQGVKKDPSKAAYIKYRLSVLPVSASSIDATSFKYEAFTEQIYTINLNNTYYGGSIDLSTGLMTVTWVAVELNGTETWDAISSYNSTTGIGMARCYPEYIDLRKKAALDVTLNSNCTHFSYLGNFGGIAITDGTVTTPRFFYTNGTDSAHGQARFAVPYSDVADFKAWLAAQKTAGTPVMLTYKIYEPFTVQLSSTEILSLIQTDRYTPRLNTIYTDADSVQISYLKSPIRDEYEKTQAILSLGGNS